MHPGQVLRMKFNTLQTGTAPESAPANIKNLDQADLF